VATGLDAGLIIAARLNTWALNPSIVQDYAKKIGVQDRVIILGQVLTERMKRFLYNLSDCLIYPLKLPIEYDTVVPPVSVLEAMACETPVLAVTDSEYFRGVISDGFNGFVGNLDELDRILVKILGDKNLRQKVSTNARKTIVTGYSLEAVGQKIKELYTTL